MRLSTRTRYGVRAMLELAIREGSTPVSTREIADKQHISPKYLEAVLTAVRKAGLVRSVRGAGGGHVLARSATEITLREVFEVLEGAEAFVPCTSDPTLCDRVGECVAREVWADMYAASMAALEAITLAELAQRAKERQGSLPGMYYI